LKKYYIKKQCSPGDVSSLTSNEYTDLEKDSCVKLLLRNGAKPVDGSAEMLNRFFSLLFFLCVCGELLEQTPQKKICVNKRRTS